MNKKAVKTIIQGLDLLGSQLRIYPEKITSPIQINAIGKFLEASAYLLANQVEEVYPPDYSEVWQHFFHLYRSLMSLFQSIGFEGGDK